MQIVSIVIPNNALFLSLYISINLRYCLSSYRIVNTV